MKDPAMHLRDDQLLLYSSGELHEISNRLVAAHIKSCAECKARLNQLEGTLKDVTKAQRFARHAELPSAAGPRALLKAQLAGLSTQADAMRKRSARERFTGAGWLLNWRRGMVFAGLALIAMLAANRAWHRMETQNLASVLAEEPNAHLTPGAVVAATQSPVCVDSAETPAVIPAAMKTRVLQLYGVAGGQSDAYEVDYLITPELGGATDIRNLWPEPYDHTVWNAHVKDRLENRLREMVCHGDIDLATAQHDLSTDWIAAYRKYFHADTPVTGSS
jgi:hypothetical protein